MRILLAEDDHILADGLTRSLRHAGYAVDHVKTGSDADLALSAHQFDLLILDLGLPKMSGLEVLRRMRTRGSMVPVLILTAADSVEERVKGLDLGADCRSGDVEGSRSVRKAHVLGHGFESAQRRQR